MARRYFREAMCAVVLSVTALSSGCAAVPSRTSPPAAATVPSPSASASPLPDDVEDALEVEDSPHDSVPPASPGDPTETVGIATAALTAFCRPALAYDAWIGELYPFLSQAAGAAYETVDPANVPCTTVTGEAVIHDGNDPYTVGIFIPTDAGEYEVYLHRTGEDSPWAVEQISPASAD